MSKNKTFKNFQPVLIRERSQASLRSTSDKKDKPPSPIKQNGGPLFMLDLTKNKDGAPKNNLSLP